MNHAAQINTAISASSNMQPPRDQLRIHAFENDTVPPVLMEWFLDIYCASSYSPVYACTDQSHPVGQQRESSPRDVGTPRAPQALPAAQARPCPVPSGTGRINCAL